MRLNAILGESATTYIRDRQPVMFANPFNSRMIVRAMSKSHVSASCGKRAVSKALQQGTTSNTEDASTFILMMQLLSELYQDFCGPCQSPIKTVKTVKALSQHSVPSLKRGVNDTSLGFGKN